MNQKTFDLDATRACKGMAVILLLWHHLFGEYTHYGNIVFKTALHAKVCVAMFVILSGYGYSESLKLKPSGVFEFYKKRFIAIYSNYWFIALIFVPISVVFYHRTIQTVFTAPHPYIKFLIQMTGLHQYFYIDWGYNCTWWYMSVIIPLTFLFPFIYDAVRKYGYLALLCFFLILIPTTPVVRGLNEWFLAFAVGIFASQRNQIVALSDRLGRLGWLRYVLLFFIIIALMPLLRSQSPVINDTRIDWFFGMVVILTTFELSMSSRLLGRSLSFLGGHLFNIFLFHTFLYYYFWTNFIYSFKNPLLIFLVLFSLCLGISIALEFIKKMTGFYALTKKLNSFKIPPAVEIAFLPHTAAGLKEHPKPDLEAA